MLCYAAILALLEQAVVLSMLSRVIVVFGLQAGLELRTWAWIAVFMDLLVAQTFTAC